jgi:hypothetical protein
VATGSTKCKRGYGGVCGGVWRSLRMARVWSLESGGRFCVGEIGGNLETVAMSMFPHLIYFEKKFYTFNVICKDNDAINYITVQHKERFIFVKFNGPYAWQVCSYLIKYNLI